MTKIHPSAIIHEGAVIGEDCEIGPYCVIGENVVLGDGNILHNNVVLGGPTIIGDGNKIFSFAVLGTDPQDLKYAGEPTRLRIGSNNIIREFCTINRSALMQEDTVVGDGNLLMEYVHIAHNCQIGNGCIIANVVQLAGHVHIHDFATIGGVTAVHQFVHIGSYSFVGGASAIKKDIVPFSRGQGNPYLTVGLNSVGLTRKGFANEDVAAIKAIYNLFYRSKLNTSQALAATESMELSEYQQLFVDFVKHAERGIST
ncbi:MAG: acyl-ACP--UDP-N-acetylglucosamine O-acyltransferase [Candidatus Cloacimonetes bacterium]|jgi:UDP-N-acetylglucosamine acyltransferase|nr:acyl-ACP--UDP-N-acetylglucosamine O-acyltransferase [Candidatus Cloacimonadota bacterium]MDY0230625.1 acyl-ACP--UDP-N-acetylglucosamine O-acyltransferase [Candidatus Cloacimonadaceae bacterium]